MAKKKKKRLTEEERRLARQLVQVDDKATEKKLKKKVVSKSSKKEKKRPSGVEAELKKADRIEKNIQERRDLKSERNPKSERKPDAINFSSVVKSFKDLGKLFDKKKPKDDDPLKGIKYKVIGNINKKKKKSDGKAEQKLLDKYSSEEGSEKDAKGFERLRQSLKEKKLPEKQVKQGKTNPEAFDPKEVRSKEAKELIKKGKQKVVDYTIPAGSGEKAKKKKTYLEKVTDKRAKKLEANVTRKAGDVASRGPVNTATALIGAGAVGAAIKKLHPASKKPNIPVAKVKSTKVGGVGDISTEVKDKVNLPRVPHAKASQINPGTGRIDPNAILKNPEIKQREALKQQRLAETQGASDEAGVNARSEVDNFIDTAKDLGAEGVRVGDYIQKQLTGQFAKTKEQIRRAEQIGAEALEGLHKAGVEAKGLSEQGVDPSRYFHEMGSVQKAFTALSIGLGGYAAGILGKENTALKMFKDLIDNDFKAQVKALEKKQKGALDRVNLFKLKIQGAKDFKKGGVETLNLMGKGLINLLDSVVKKQTTQQGIEAGARLMTQLKGVLDRNAYFNTKLSDDEFYKKYDINADLIKAESKRRQEIAKANQIERGKTDRKNIDTAIEKGKQQVNIFKAKTKAETDRLKANQKTKTDLVKHKATIKSQEARTNATITSGVNKMTAQIGAANNRAIGKDILDTLNKKWERDHKKDKMFMQAYDKLRDHNRKENEFKIEEARKAKEFGLDHILKEDLLNLRSDDFQKKWDKWERDFDIETEKMRRQLNKDDRNYKINLERLDLRRKELKAKIDSGFYKVQKIKLDKQASDIEFLKTVPSDNLIRFSNKKPKGKLINAFKTVKDYNNFSKQEAVKYTAINYSYNMAKLVKELAGANIFDYWGNLLSDKVILGDKKVREIWRKLGAYEAKIVTTQNEVRGGGNPSDKDMERAYKASTGMRQLYDDGLLSRSKILSTLKVLEDNVTESARSRNLLVKQNFKGDLSDYLIEVRENEILGKFIPKDQLDKILNYGKR